MSPFQSAADPAQRYQDRHLALDFERNTAQLDGEPLPVPRKEFELLVYMARRPGELISRESLLRSVWGYSAGIRTRTLDVHIRRLRKRLGPYGKFYIETIFGIGYRFQPCPAAAGPDSAAMDAVLGGQPGSGAWRLGYLA